MPQQLLAYFCRHSDEKLNCEECEKGALLTGKAQKPSSPSLRARPPSALLALVKRTHYFQTSGQHLKWMEKVSGGKSSSQKRDHQRVRTFSDF